MESPKIKILLEKYWEGNSTVQEEAQLKSLFKNGIPKDEKKYKLIFDYQSTLSANESNFDLGLLNEAIKKNEIENSFRSHTINWRKWSIGTAAAILIAIGSVYYQWDSIEGPPLAENDKVENAYEETVAALAFLAEALNKGNSSIYELSTFDKSKKQIINEDL